MSAAAKSRKKSWQNSLIIYKRMPANRRIKFISILTKIYNFKHLTNAGWNTNENTEKTEI